ncbi:MAG: hypothetical protein MEPRV_02557 [Providencia sp.]
MLKVNLNKGASMSAVCLPLIIAGRLLVSLVK